MKKYESIFLKKKTFTNLLQILVIIKIHQFFIPEIQKHWKIFWKIIH